MYALAFSPDGAQLASAGFEGEVILWDMTTQAEQLRIAIGEVTINDLAFSPDGSLLAVATDDDGTLSIWDANDGSALANVAVDPDYSLDAVAFSPDGAQIATGGGDYLARIWDLAELLADPAAAEPLLTLDGPIDTITDLAFSPDGTTLAAASLDLRVFLWDTAEGTLLNTLQGHAGSVYSLDFNAAGTLLASGSSDGTAKIWRLDTGQPLLTLAGHSDFVYGVAFSPDEQHLATASLDGSGRIWRLAFAPPDGTLTVAANPAGDLLATIGNSDLRLWNALNGATPAVVPGSDDGFSALAFSPDGAILAVGDNAGLIGLYAVDALRADPTSAPELELAGHEDAIARLRFSPDGSRIAGASDDTTVRVWDAASGEELLVLEGFGDWVYGLAFSPDGSRIAAGDQAGLLIIWDSDGNAVTQIEVGSPVNGLAYSPDGAILAVAADDGTIYRYDNQGAPLAALVHGAQVSALHFSAEGVLFSSGVDARIRYWQGDTAQIIPVPAAVYAFAVLPNNQLASVGADGVVYIHELLLENLRSAAQQ
ncbi:MAG: hypothetical protein HC822_09190 [Oscillochloris sp.]|nr:hypothetical protein [Oscillochloris sp.]